MTIFFSNFIPKIPKSGIFSSKFIFFFFCKILQLDKVEGADFKYDNSFFKFQPKNTQISYLWSQIEAFLFFHKILQLDKFEGADMTAAFLKF